MVKVWLVKEGSEKKPQNVRSHALVRSKARLEA
jgi:hypothetical protein